MKGYEAFRIGGHWCKEGRTDEEGGKVTFKESGKTFPLAKIYPHIPYFEGEFHEGIVPFLIFLRRRFAFPTEETRERMWEIASS